MPMLTLDGRFGLRTHNNVMSFQGCKSLFRDGIVGPKTANALGWTYSGPPSLPYKLRMEPAGKAPPLSSIADAILRAMDVFHAAITEEVRNCGATQLHLDRALDALSIPYDSLKENLDHLKSYSNFGPDSLYLKTDLAHYQVTVLKIGVYLKDHGGSMRRLALMNDALDVEHIGEIVQRLFKGEETAVVVIAKLDLHVQLASRRVLQIPSV